MVKYCVITVGGKRGSKVGMSNGHSQYVKKNIGKSR